MKVFSLFQNKFGDVWIDEVPEIKDYAIKVQRALCGLKRIDHVNHWIIAIDEYHFIFSGLSPSDMENIAETMKVVLLDNDSPCYFMLAGSTQATFWWALDQTRPNGLNLMTNAVVVTTPFVSSEQEIDLCKDVLNQKENTAMNNLQDIVKLLELQNVVNLCQISRYLSTQSPTPMLAYDRFVESKMAVYWRDYYAVPQGITPDKFINWANGSNVKPPSQLEHLLEKRGILYFLRDPNFAAFLKQYYNPHTHKLENIQAAIPWSDVILFLPLLPLGQNQKEQKIDENGFDQLAWGLHNAVFSQNGWAQFANFLTQHVANPAYVHKQPNDVTWVLVMRMLRNIVAHEKTINWSGLMACLNEVIVYTKTRANFRSLITAYEQSLL